jgi:hypothetical protein
MLQCICLVCMGAGTVGIGYVTVQALQFIRRDMHPQAQIRGASLGAKRPC